MLLPGGGLWQEPPEPVLASRQLGEDEHGVAEPVVAGLGVRLDRGPHGRPVPVVEGRDLLQGLPQGLAVTFVTWSLSKIEVRVNDV